MTTHEHKPQQPEVSSRHATQAESPAQPENIVPNLHPVNPKTVLTLQRQYGNQIVQQLLQRKSVGSKTNSFIQQFLSTQGTSIQREESEEAALEKKARDIIKARKQDSQVYKLGTISKLETTALHDLISFLEANPKATPAEIDAKIKELEAAKYEKNDTEENEPVTEPDNPIVDEPRVLYEDEVVTAHHPTKDLQLGKGTIEEGIVEIDMNTANSENSNPKIAGRRVFHLICDTFEQNGKEVNGVKGLWDESSDNLTTLNKQVKEGKNIEDAVWETFTGKMAKERNFNNVHVDDEGTVQTTDGTYTDVLVIFFP